MASILELYNPPQDPAAFDAYYRATHMPLVHTIPGLRALRLSQGPVTAASGASSYSVTAGEMNVASGATPYYLIAELMFDSVADLQNGLASAEGRAAADDLNTFAGMGVTILMYDTQDA
jgi:uncharacterized protein (TIGR02118 family)